MFGGFQLQAQVVLGVDWRFYSDAAGTPYVDVYYSLDPASASYVLDGDEWEAKIGVKMIIGQQADAVLMSVRSADSAAAGNMHVQKSVFVLPAEAAGDTLPVSIVVEDLVSGEAQELADVLAVPGAGVRVSVPLIIEEMAPGEGLYSKWGQKVVPVPVSLVTMDTTFDKLNFFTQVEGATGAMVAQIGIADAAGNWLEGMAKMVRVEAGNTPLFLPVGMEDLKSGLYSAKVRLLDASGQEVDVKEQLFYRVNTAADLAMAEWKDKSLNREYFEKIWGSWDMVGEYLSMCAPVATMDERRILMTLKGSTDTLLCANFLMNFWEQRDPLNPQGTWKDYLTVVEKVNLQFGTTVIPGYKTEMGRVFLQYGAPTLVENRPFDGKNYPYQMWQYDQLISASTPEQHNVVFIFVDQEMVGRDYTLIHSSAVGEVKDHKWQIHLSRKSESGPDIDATSTQYARDNFGERITNSIITGGQGVWFNQYNR